MLLNVGKKKAKVITHFDKNDYLHPHLAMLSNQDLNSLYECHHFILLAEHIELKEMKGIIIHGPPQKLRTLKCQKRTFSVQKSQIHDFFNTFW